MIGRVVSTKMQKSATVVVERTASHPLYKKTFIRSKKYLVDNLIGVKDGDLVEIVKVRPISQNKHFRISKVIGKNLAEIVEAEQREAAEAIIAEVMPEEKEEESRVENQESAEEKKTENKKPKKRKEKTSP